MPTFPLQLRNAELDAHNAKTLARIIRETAPDTIAIRTDVISHLGDERQLRGIPVVGAPGVGGAINGTRPGQIR